MKLLTDNNTALNTVTGFRDTIPVSLSAPTLTPGARRAPVATTLLQAVTLSHLVDVYTRLMLPGYSLTEQLTRIWI